MRTLHQQWCTAWYEVELLGTHPRADYLIELLCEARTAINQYDDQTEQRRGAAIIRDVLRQCGKLLEAGRV